MFNLLKIRMSIDILKMKNVKLLLALSIYVQLICYMHLDALKHVQRFRWKYTNSGGRKKSNDSFEGQSNKFNDGEEETTTTMENTI